jgi:hypothetical protein
MLDMVKREIASKMVFLARRPNRVKAGQTGPQNAPLARRENGSIK